MIEILIAAAIFAIGMLPVLTLTTTTTRAAHFETRHLVATQLAAGVLDRLLALPYGACRRQAVAWAQPRRVADAADLRGALAGLPAAADGGAAPAPHPPAAGGGTGGDGGTVIDEHARQLLACEVSVEVADPLGSGEVGELFTLTVIVTWPAEDSGQHRRRQITLSAIKYRGND